MLGLNYHSWQCTRFCLSLPSLIIVSTLNCVCAFIVLVFHNFFIDIRLLLWNLLHLKIYFASMFALFKFHRIIRGHIRQLKSFIMILERNRLLLLSASPDLRHPKISFLPIFIINRLRFLCLIVHIWILNLAVLVICNILGIAFHRLIIFLFKILIMFFCVINIILRHGLSVQFIGFLMLCISRSRCLIINELPFLYLIDLSR